MQFKEVLNKNSKENKTRQKKIKLDLERLEIHKTDICLHTICYTRSQNAGFEEDPRDEDPAHIYKGFVQDQKMISTPRRSGTGIKNKRIWNISKGVLKHEFKIILMPDDDY